MMVGRADKKRKLDEISDEAGIESAVDGIQKKRRVNTKVVHFQIIKSDFVIKVL